jgi:hypothetical protein
MNFICVCLHSLDMRDFHSHLRDTPFLDRLREESIFAPSGRAQGHHQGDSLNAELTGIWTARFCDSRLGEDGFRRARSCWLPETLIEAMEASGFDTITRLAQDQQDRLGTHAVGGGMRHLWLKDEPHRLGQFASPRFLEDLEDWLEEIHRSDHFYAHVFLRQTHRPWADPQGLYGLFGETAPEFWGYPHDVSRARRAALEHPDELAALRRRGLAKADRAVERIFEATRDIPDVAYLVYSNHGEVFDHFRYQLPHPDLEGEGMIRGTSHGPYPYEVLYANMQLWVIPGRAPRVVSGIARSIDIAPTVLDLAGVERAGLDGKSMLGHFDAGRFPDRDRYAENHTGACVSMVRADGWKVISTGKLPPGTEPREAPDFHDVAVFDLRSDPWEYVNLADTPQGREALAWAVARHEELGRRRVPAPAAA